MRKRTLAVPFAAALTLALLPQPARAVDEVNTKKLRDAVTVAGILGHERVLQRIATQNGGTRASGTPGFAASAAYVGDVLRKAGYQVTEQKFTFPFFRDLSPAQLTPVTPAGPAYPTNTLTYSISGDVTGQVVPALNNVLPPTPAPSSTAGCAPGDFTRASATAPQIALIQRGGCNFAVKAANAAAAGYDAAIIFNEGQPGRTDLFQGTLGDPSAIPVVALSFADGSALAAAPGIVRVQTNTEINLAASTSNIIADYPGGDPNRVLVVGSHLDSVVPGPGINDDGSGTAQDLEIAVQLAKLKTKTHQKVRFAFWGAEEAGLLGSTYYVSHLSDTDLSHIFANLNFDMVASPNYVRFVYDGDGSATGTAGPYGSDQIENLFTTYFTAQGLPTAPTAFDGRSDYGPFIAAGIPAGGLFSGAEGVKTAEEATVYGGTAGKPYDACYHQACDNINNLNPKALNEFADAATHAVLTLAKTKTGFYPDGSLRAARRTATPANSLYRGDDLVR
ncbi:aminopeptidase Y [Actinoplanes sp. SE50]|uniref:M28 family metallopeptidase n=1 Tax=unclassified Actinoplanes TaxID=2626549 RepID=UPI00023ECEF7|nr:MULTISPECIES: M28 family metallopeptidase [unclassified Actinoplanes]AEV86059.1 aminopeptidase Y [Actinoplanes sp. SE50/110]ATO84457.1 aminopeptidase Y [Actinoplanes sp. SE50]SLM01867.1 aminopeptidase Y [Actinoplanes sp. SE50/110]